jgi:hypothetical protein
MKRSFWENLIFVAIILVVVQTFIEDYAVVAGWSVHIRNMLLVSGLVFDVIFTIEFAVRSFFAAREDSVVNYWRYRRGWVDFLSSVPLLLLNSGPAVYLLYFGDGLGVAAGVGVLNILKVVKAVRVTRILRLVRLLKIFGRIHNADSIMAQFHTATIATTAVFSIILVLMGFSVFSRNPMAVQSQERAAHYSLLLDHAEEISRTGKKEPEAVMRALVDRDTRILEAGSGGRATFHGADVNYREYHTPDEYIRVEKNGMYMIVSIADLHAAQAFMISSILF